MYDECTHTHTHTRTHTHTHTHTRTQVYDKCTTNYSVYHQLYSLNHHKTGYLPVSRDGNHSTATTTQLLQHMVTQQLQQHMAKLQQDVVTQPQRFNYNNTGFLLFTGQPLQNRATTQLPQLHYYHKTGQLHSYHNSSTTTKQGHCLTQDTCLFLGMANFPRSLLCLTVGVKGE